MRASSAVALVVLLAGPVACGGSPNAGDPRVSSAAGAAGTAGTVRATGVNPGPAAVAPSSGPPASPSAVPEAPPGAVYVASSKLFVERCDAAQACPRLLQRKGVAHCAGLRKGEGLVWRLPELAELKAVLRAPGLEDVAGFHWTATAYDEDPKQRWIYDAKEGLETSIPPDRKPFTIRCVATAPKRGG